MSPRSSRSWPRSPRWKAWSLGQRASANPGIVAVDFLPHLIPMTRGILSACHVRPTRPITQAELDDLYADGVRRRAVRDGRRPAPRHQARDRQQRGPRSTSRSTRGRTGSSPSASRTTSSRVRPARRSRRSTSSTACPRRPGSSSSRSRHDHSCRILPIPTSSTVLPPVERRSAMPAGFRAGGLAAGIKASGRPDLAVIVTTGGPAAAAAVFTPNSFAAAPGPAVAGPSRGDVGRSARRVRLGRTPSSRRADRPTRPRAPAGDDDQARDRPDARRRRPGVEVERTLHLSTGIIGTRLPLDKVASRAGDDSCPTLAADRRRRAGRGRDALRTTDSVAKVVTTTIDTPRCRRPARSRSP